MINNENARLSRSQLVGLCILCCFALLIASYALTFPWVQSVQGLHAFKQGQLIPWLGYGHFMGGGIALIAGSIQLWTRRPSKLHTLFGYTYCIAVLVSALSAFYLISITEFGMATLGLLILNIIWVGSTGYALKCALAGDIKAHRRWILRSLALTCAAITFRLMILSFMLFMDFELAYLLVTWLSWIFNLVVLEIYLHRERAPKKLPLGSSEL